MEEGFCSPLTFQFVSKRMKQRQFSSPEFCDRHELFNLAACLADYFRLGKESFSF